MNNISRKFGTEKCIVICCDCGKVKTTDDRWIDVPTEVIEKTDGYKNRSHTYCTVCSKKVMAEIKKQRIA